MTNPNGEENDIEVYTITDDEGENEEDDVNIEDDKELVGKKGLALAYYINGTSVKINTLQHKNETSIPTIIDFYEECKRKYGDTASFISLQTEELYQSDRNDAEDFTSTTGVTNAENEAELQKLLSTKQAAVDPLYKAIRSITDRLSIQHILADPRSYLKAGGNDQFYDKNDPFLDDAEMHRELNWKGTLDHFSSTSDDETSDGEELSRGALLQDRDAGSVAFSFERPLLLEADIFRCDNIPENDSTTQPDAEVPITFNPRGWRTALKHIPHYCKPIFESLEQKLQALPDTDVDASKLWKLVKVTLKELFDVLTHPDWLMSTGKLTWYNPKKHKKEAGAGYDETQGMKSDIRQLSSHHKARLTKNAGEKTIASKDVEVAPSHMPLHEVGEATAELSSNHTNRGEAEEDTSTKLQRPASRLFVQMDLTSLLRVARCFAKITNAVRKSKLCSFWVSLLMSNTHDVFCAEENEFIKILKASRLFERGNRKHADKVKFSIRQWRHIKNNKTKRKGQAEQTAVDKNSTIEPLPISHFADSSPSRIAFRPAFVNPYTTSHCSFKKTIPQSGQTDCSGFQHRHKIRPNAIVPPYVKCFAYIAEEFLKYAYLNKCYKCAIARHSTLLYEALGEVEIKDAVPSTSRKLSALLEAMFKRRYGMTVKIPEEFMDDILKCYKSIYPGSDIEFSAGRKRMLFDSTELTKKRKRSNELLDNDGPVESTTSSKAISAIDKSKVAVGAPACDSSTASEKTAKMQKLASDGCSDTSYAPKQDEALLEGPISVDHSEVVVGVAGVKLRREKNTLCGPTLAGKFRYKGEMEKAPSQIDIRDLYRNKFSQAVTKPATECESVCSADANQMGYSATTADTEEPRITKQTSHTAEQSHQSPLHISTESNAPKPHSFDTTGNCHLDFERAIADFKEFALKEAKQLIEIIDVDQLLNDSYLPVEASNGKVEVTGTENGRSNKDGQDKSFGDAAVLLRPNLLPDEQRVISIQTAKSDRNAYLSSSDANAKELLDERKSTQEPKLYNGKPRDIRTQDVIASHSTPNVNSGRQFKKALSQGLIQSSLQFPMELDLWYFSEHSVGSVTLLIEAIHSVSRQDVLVPDVKWLESNGNKNSQSYGGMASAAEKPFVLNGGHQSTDEHGKQIGELRDTHPVSNRFCSISAAVYTLRNILIEKGLYLLHEPETEEKDGTNLSATLKREDMQETEMHFGLSSPHAAYNGASGIKTSSDDRWEAWKVVRLKGKPASSLYETIMELSPEFYFPSDAV